MKLKGLSALLSLSFIVLFFACTKINEATELGGDLIPAVDNVNTFDTTLEVQAAYYPFDDSTRQIINVNSGINDFLALGHINDPAFGTTNANMYFNLGSLSAYGTNPFVNRDSVKSIDSVVLSLSFQGSYGDTTAQLSVQVSELTASNGFNDDSTYRFDKDDFSSGPVLGSRMFSISELNDSVTVNRKNDTTKVANVLRVRLNNTLGDRLRMFDTAAASPLGGFSSDSAFRSMFRGLAVKTVSASGNGALAYFNLVDFAKSRLIVYYKAGRSTGIDSGASVAFGHIRTTGQANSIKRTPSGEYLAKIANPASQKFYIQSSPAGSYVSMYIPKLSGFPNKVIHRAELIAYRVPADISIADNVFTTPIRLTLDHKGPNNIKDSAYIFDADIQPGIDGSLNFAAFGGTLRTDDSYRFNLTRYVQGIVTRGDRNDSLRLFAPLRSSMFSRSLKEVISIPNLDRIAKGRVVIAGTNFPDASRRLRLRIIYSNL